jgi:hypothetical protein
MRRRDQWIGQIRAVEREHQVIAVATKILSERLAADPSALRGHGLDYRDYQTSIRNLDATYLIRLFAEFESGLREAWERAFSQSSHPRMVDLLQALAARCRMPQDRLDDADRVRVYRNSLVHEGGEEVEPIPMGTARGHLCRFFSMLPSDWSPG